MGDTSSGVFYAGKGLFDGESETLRAGAGVLAVDGRVAGVGEWDEFAGSGVTRVDLGDRVIVPGFVDAHTHVTLRPGEGNQPGQRSKPVARQTVRAAENLRQILLSGVTTARIMNEGFDIDVEFRTALAKGEACGPRLTVCGIGLAPPDGHGSALGGVAGVDDLRAAVAGRARTGADHIKIYTTGGVSSTNTSLGESQYSADEIAAIIDEAATAGLHVSAHAHGGPGVDLAVARGIHSIEHGAMLTEQSIAAMVEHGTWLVMTSTILFHPDGIERGDAGEPAVMEKVKEARVSTERVARQVREAGVRVALGTDSMHGLFGYEIQWMVERGWSVGAALRAATSGGADLLGIDDIGRLRVGARADFAVLGGDPFDDIDAVREVSAVYLDGVEVVSDGFCRSHRDPYGQTVNGKSVD